jgi:hypothetical protein
LARATDAEPGAISVATTRASGRSVAIAHAMQPEPVHASSTRGSSVSAMSSSAASTSTSVSGLGMKTPGSTRTTMWRKGISPVTYCNGSPAARRFTPSRSVVRSSSVSGRSWNA